MSVPDRLGLYQQGRTDQEIAAETGAKVDTIKKWRQHHGFPSNKVGKTHPAVHAERLALYQQGLSDRQIADRLGMGQAGVTGWRKRNGLAANVSAWTPFDPDQNAARMLLYTLGYSDGRIAKEQGVNHRSIHMWRRRRGLSAHGYAKAIWRDDRRRVDPVLARVRRAIGRALPRDIADAAASNLYMDILTGKIELAELEKYARRYGNRALDQYASRWGPKSLDMAIGDTEDFTLMDTLVDESSSSWLEEMGATVF